MFNNFFSENRAVREIVWKNMRIPCWVSKATLAHSHTHTHTHPTHTHPLSHTHTPTHTHTHTLTRTHTRTHSHTHTLTQTHTLTHTSTHSHTHSHTPTHTHSQYAIIIIFILQKWLHTSASQLHYTYSTLPVLFPFVHLEPTPT